MNYYYDENIHALVYVNQLPDNLSVGYADGINVEEIVTPQQIRYIVTEVSF